MSATNPRLMVDGAVTPDAAVVADGPDVVDFDELQAATTTVALTTTAASLVIRAVVRGTVWLLVWWWDGDAINAGSIRR
jgi:ABC-type transport system involved in cytochrome c biogenesis permease subunit